MKKHRNIQARILFTLSGMTVAILLILGLTFNLFVQGYVRRRVKTQLASVSKSASSERRDKSNGQHKKHSDGQPDRIIGTTGSAIVLDENGALVSSMHGDKKVAEVISEYFAANGIDKKMKYRILSLDIGKYAVSVSEDPVKDNCYIVSYVNATSILSFTIRINIVLLILIILAILLSVILSRHFAKTFAEPVQELSEFARQIGGGELKQREFDFRDVEFKTLADSMNHMVYELNESKQKQEIFFQNVSHELRTPLTSIRGNAEGIVYDVMEPKNAAHVILSESDKLGGMVEDILFLSRMGKPVPNRETEPIDLRDVLSLCVSEQHTDADTKGISFCFDFDESPVELLIREQDAQRLFGNLISNAIRYAQSEVKLICRKENDGLFISVTDDGQGISEEDLPHIFERFYRGKDGNHGIGLAIAQSVVESYNGSIVARSGDGTVFEVRFPK